MLLREERFCYEAANGRKIRLLPPDAQVPEIPSGPEETWDVWEFNSEDEVFSKEAERFGLKAGPPISPVHGWDITNAKHQQALVELLRQHKPKLIVMASATRAWCNSIARRDPEVRAWLSERERKHIPLIQELIKAQVKNKCEVLFEMPLGTWLLDLPEMAAVKERCHGGDAQVTDFCEFGLKDPENKLPHKRPTALLATFQLRRAVRKCSGHHGLAHQWTKGYLSKRFGGVSRLGYSQRWTTMFCRDLLQDFADHCNPLRHKLGELLRPRLWGLTSLDLDRLTV